MPSFDVVSELEIYEVNHAVSNTTKEILTRFDFRGSHFEMELDKKNFIVKVEAESDMKMQQVVDVILSRGIKQGIDANAFDFSKEAYPSGKVVKKEVPVTNGLKQDDAKKIVKLIKDAGLKVQAQIMDEMVRVTGKKIDDLQEVIAMLRGSNLNIPLQFTNMKS